MHENWFRNHTLNATVSHFDHFCGRTLGIPYANPWTYSKYAYYSLLRFFLGVVTRYSNFWHLFTSIDPCPLLALTHWNVTAVETSSNIVYSYMYWNAHSIFTNVEHVLQASLSRKHIKHFSHMHAKPVNAVENLIKTFNIRLRTKAKTGNCFI